MKSVTLILALAAAGLAGAALVPDLQEQAFILTASAAGAGVLAAITAATIKSKPATAPAHQPVAPPPAPRPEAEIVSLLSVLQEKGRLVDFLMEDVTSYQDAQIGAAARVVHQGCRAALLEHFSIEPMLADAEGSTVTVPADHPADQYRLTGNLSGEAPFSGTLVHKGWKATTVKLPRLLVQEGKEDHLPAIAPAEVEVA